MTPNSKKKQLRAKWVGHRWQWWVSPRFSIATRLEVSTKLPENCLQKGKCSSSIFSRPFCGLVSGWGPIWRWQKSMSWFLLMWIWFHPEPQMLVLVNQDDSTFLCSASQPRASGILLGESSQDSFQWLIGSWWGSGNVGDPFQMAELHRLYMGVILTTEPSTGSPSANHA